MMQNYFSVVINMSHDRDGVKFIDVKVWRQSGLTEAWTGAGPGPGPVQLYFNLPDFR